MRHIDSSRYVEFPGIPDAKDVKAGLDIGLHFGRVRYPDFDGVRYMETRQALTRLSALATPSRLQALRLLAQHEKGLASGELARRLNVPQNTISTQLSTLEQADLVQWRRESRSVVYTANVEAVRELMDFLDEECAAGRCKRRTRKA
jgi:DNA-binding transcriptional ArsR family regulator